MDDNIKDNPLEDITEAILLTNKEGHDNTGALLEAIIKQNENNNPEPLLEASILQSKKTTKEIVAAIKEKPEVQKVKLEMDK